MAENASDELASRPFNLADIEEEELERLISITDDTVVILLPVPSIGSSNSHIDICDDLIEISWFAELIASVSGSVTAREDYDGSRYRTSYLLTVDRPGPGFGAAIRKSAILFNRDDDDGDDFQTRYADVRNEVLDYEDSLSERGCAAPEILESYYANLVGGAYNELRYEAPERYADDVAKFPERRVEFWKSAFSARIGAQCYTSCDSWLIPAAVDPDSVFLATDQQYRIGNFIAGQILTIANASYVIADGLVMHFPMSQYFKSRVCASFAVLEEDDSWPSEAFDWSDASFTCSPYREMLLAQMPEDARAPSPREAACLVDPNGSLVIINDGQFRHILYDTKSLQPTDVKQLHSIITSTSEIIATGIDGSPDLACDWSSLTDEDFEQLCYDVILTHPRFDRDTIRKHGKSRSRDGGRDIEVFDMPHRAGGARRKWIFQCKLVSGSGSLSASKVLDIGDMLDHYDVGGFGVMTSAPIDATLYDKLDAVCDRRGVEKLTLSVLELERTLARNPVIRERYFGTQTRNRS
ncbi:hypothetical protein ACFSTI_06575 [Rhizorhabdus histidinilytica]|nr:hypothetical protein [Rhizorhabdus histidinilytica]